MKLYPIVAIYLILHNQCCDVISRDSLTKNLQIKAKWNCNKEVDIVVLNINWLEKLSWRHNCYHSRNNEKHVAKNHTSNLRYSNLCVGRLDATFRSPILSGVPRAFPLGGGGLGGVCSKIYRRNSIKNHAKMTYFRVWKCGKTWRFQEITIDVVTIITLLNQKHQEDEIEMSLFVHVLTLKNPGQIICAPFYSAIDNYIRRTF